MKVLLVSTNDRSGGAAIGAYRLHQALQRSGVESEMLVLRKVTADPSVHRLSSYLNRSGRARRRLAEYRHHRQLAENPRLADSGHWSLNQFSTPIAEVINSFSADIVHLQWVGDGYLPISELDKIKAPIVWTLHDMWAFTGGCHYTGECERFSDDCGKCPQLLAPKKDDISARIAREKKKAWLQLPFTVVCPSHWLADCATQSSLLRNKRIEVIPNPIDHNVFKPNDKTLARRAFNLPLDRQLVLFGAVGGAADPRKGFAFLREALGALDAASGIELVVFGGEPAESLELDLPQHQFGQLRDELSLSLLYNASDVYVLPALQENLPNTLMEALACGTPCAAFATGGVADLVQHQQNGYLAGLRDPADLFHGIKWILSQAWDADALHRQSLNRYSVERISERYVRIYRSLSVSGTN